jgi:hypothetical protein
LGSGCRSRQAAFRNEGRAQIERELAVWINVPVEERRQCPEILGVEAFPEPLLFNRALEQNRVGEKSGCF